jgi:hypothetical protein
MCADSPSGGIIDSHARIATTVGPLARNGNRPAWLLALVLLFTSVSVLLAGNVFAAAAIDGAWRLNIQGHNTYLYGEPQLGGGLRIPWEVDIRFRVADATFVLGNGQASIAGPAIPVSNPPGWIECRMVKGSYLDSSLTLHEMPRIRFARFPVAGETSDGQVFLRPGYTPPGNYLAVTYECQMQDTAGTRWFDLAERGKQVMGKRQDPEKRVDGDRLHVRVREVMGVPPEQALTLPLVDGWEFSTGLPDEPHWVRYRLIRD